MLTLFTTPVIYLLFDRLAVAAAPDHRRELAPDGTPAMNMSAPFIARPIATTLLTVGIALAGIFAFFRLPVSPLPQVDFPTISVQAACPAPARTRWPPASPARWSGISARSPT